MKKTYITPEITFMEADACEPLCASQGTKYGDYFVGGGKGGNQNSFEGGLTMGDGGDDEFTQGAKPGDFFCDNFEYDFDF